MNYSAFLKLKWENILNGLAGAVTGAVVEVVKGMIDGGTFNVLTLDWSAVGVAALNAAALFVITDLLTNKDGKYLGAIKR